MYKSNTKYTNRYGDKYWWEPIENGYKFVMEGNSLRYCRIIGDTAIHAFDPSGGPYISVGEAIDGKTIKSILPRNGSFDVEVSDD